MTTKIRSENNRHLRHTSLQFEYSLKSLHSTFVNLLYELTLAQIKLR